jgi:hypothetical protein
LAPWENTRKQGLSRLIKANQGCSFLTIEDDEEHEDEEDSKLGQNDPYRSFEGVAPYLGTGYFGSRRRGVE